MSSNAVIPTVSSSSGVAQTQAPVTLSRPSQGNMMGGNLTSRAQASITMLRYVGLLTRRGKAFHPVWVFALLLGASVTAAAAETLPTLLPVTVKLTPTVTNGFDHADLDTHVSVSGGPEQLRRVQNTETPVVTIAGGPTVIEGAAVTFTLTASPAPAADITVTARLTENGHFVPHYYIPNPDQPNWYIRYQFTPRKVTIGTGGTASFTVLTWNDSFAELHGAIDATVKDGDGYSVGSPSSASVTVKDDDSPDIPDKVTLSISESGPSTVTEGMDIAVVARPSTRAQVSVPAKWKITRTGDFMTSSNLPPEYEYPQWKRDFFNWLYGDGTGKGAGTWDLNMRVGSSSFHLGTENDSIDEPDGTLTAVAEYERNGQTVTSNSVTLHIRDNDPTVVSLARTDAVTEGAVAFRVSLGRGLVKGEIIDVPLAISGTGVSAAGYTLSVKSGPGAALSGSGTLTPVLRFSGAGAQMATLELVPGAGSTATRYTIALGPDGSGAKGFDRAGLGTNVGGGADPSETNNGFSVNVAPPSKATGLSAVAGNGEVS
ncbi:MAG: hypothetical protein F4158_07835, partial [Synechococcus sp. SB0675_bin_7]|nr:hypothetical protein [Synechococcus sp. SB0675_bin_7]